METQNIQTNNDFRQTENWQGATSSKFNYNQKRHVPEPVIKETKHPLYSISGKRHFEQKTSTQNDWKPSIAINPNKDQSKEDRPRGLKKVGPQNTEIKDKYEKRHLSQPASGEIDEFAVSKKTFVHHNRKTQNEFQQESVMGSKKRVQTIYDMKNGIPLKSLGDKIYKSPEYIPDFYKEGGLIAGSTHQKKIKTSGNPKIIDFYAGLELDKGPLNPNRKTWKQAVEEERLKEELDSVQSLKNWEKTILSEVDPKYQVTDDSDQEDNSQ